MAELGTRRWWALGALAICLLTLGLDGTILNVALPTLATELGAGTDGLQWIVDAYILVFAGLLHPAGRSGRPGGPEADAADRAASRSWWLVGGRGYVTGYRRADRRPGADGVRLGDHDPGRHGRDPPVLFRAGERARAIAVLAAAMGIGVPLGPIVGGYLLDHFWWGSIFLVNVPVAP